MKVLVTGGAGFVGSHLVEALHRQGCFVVVVDDLSSGKINNIRFKGVKRLRCLRDKCCLDKNIIFYQGSITDNNFLEEVFEENKRLEVCFHLAAVVSFSYSIAHKKETFRVNFTATKKLVSLSKKYDLKRFIFAGSAAEYGEEKRLPIKEKYAKGGVQLSPYGESKYLATKFVASQDNRQFVSTSLRFFNIYGPRQDPNSLYSGVISRFIEAVVNKKDIPVYGDGQQTRDFVYVDDVVRAILKAAENKSGGAIFNIGAGKSITINNLAKTVNRLGGKASKIAHLSERSGDICHSQADISRARKLLNWRPRVDLEEGLRKTFEVTTGVNL